MYSRNTHAKRRRNPNARYSLVYRNDRSANSGGILIGVTDNIKNISLELTQENKIGQRLWILLTNRKKKIE